MSTIISLDQEHTGSNPNSIIYKLHNFLKCKQGYCLQFKKSWD